MATPKPHCLCTNSTEHYASKIQINQAISFLFKLITPFFSYQGYRDREGNLTLFYWKLLAMKLSFVLIFEVISNLYWQIHVD
jgi:hypothetical protein